jgi:hypothetical protein
MKRPTCRCVIALLALFLAPLQGRSQGNLMTPATAAAPHFVSPAAFNVAQILPAPPATGYLAAQSELEVVLQVQAWRTPEQVAWARTVEKQTVFVIYGGGPGAGARGAAEEHHG